MRSPASPFLHRERPPRVLLVGGRVAAAAISAVWMVVAARLLDLGQFADLALASALSAMAVQVADLGVGIQLPQAFAGQPQGMPVAAIRQAYRRRLAGSLGAAPVFAAAFLVAADHQSLAVAAGFAVSVIATALYGAGFVALRSIDAYVVETFVEPAGRIVVLAFGTYFAMSGRGLAWVAWSYALADIAALCIVAAAVTRRGRGSVGGPRLAPVTWLVAAGPIGMVYWRADIWLLAGLATSPQVALYGSAYRLLDAALLPALVVAQLFPAPFARCAPEDRHAMVARWVRGSVTMLLPFTVFSLVLGRPLLTTLFGEEFGGATAALHLLGVAAPLTAGVFLLTTALATLDPRAYIGTAAAALAVNLAGNLLLIPHLGASGAATMTVLSQGLLVVALWAAVRRRLASAESPGAPVLRHTVRA